ncbi:S-adenosylmethionine-dependent methyltransferase [Blastomyces gilchristii SLH14081]|uniref:S-adenosylmethionine-dependent methyltransferase n=1 Tax=Blastomyces gilchristii (strain SLH14081) TaxID=559298 RepID=A0A179UIG2_BLAGS|nr:S-adenosylmethionine-dependent methyltransferase [Blastomyces gilchristii SLH14081]OAT07856.1 S-adenosylmethionine-dependent methyltransferase [Blastomyces gilchristii SLH14081]
MNERPTRCENPSLYKGETALEDLFHLECCGGLQLKPSSTNNKAITHFHHDCPFQLPIPPPRYPPYHLHKYLCPFDNAGDYGSQPERLLRDILEMRAGWGTAKPVRQFMLSGYGYISIHGSVKKGKS